MDPYENYKDTCVICEEKFTEKRPCCCDDGQTEDGKLHYHGHCVECCPLHSEKARAEKKAVAAGWDEDVYQKHIALEGSNTWNEHPDGCFYCGSSHHHSQDCPDKQLYWQSH